MNFTEIAKSPNLKFEDISVHGDLPYVLSRFLSLIILILINRFYFKILTMITHQIPFYFKQSKLRVKKKNSWSSTIHQIAKTQLTLFACIIKEQRNCSLKKFYWIQQNLTFKNILGLLKLLLMTFKASEKQKEIRSMYK